LKRKTFLILALLMVSLFVFSGIAFANEADFGFDSDTGTITSYTGPGGDVEIPTTIGGVDVVKIGDAAFSSKKTITSVTIPDSVTSIGDDAFRYCTNLTSVTIPNSVTSIGSYAFSSCTSLTSITIPNSVTSIDGYAFQYCTSLTSITIPNSVTSIGAGAFQYCTSLTSVTIPNSVTSIGNGVFSGCTSLTSVTIPDSVTSIGDDAFRYCSSLTSVTIPNSVTSIGNGVFYGCTSLTSVTIPNSVTSIGSYVFMDCTSLTSVTIPDSVTSIGSLAFEDCTSLTSVTIPNSVTSIGEGAFSSCTSLTSVTIPNSVTSIGEGAFESCTSLTSVTIPNSVTSIGMCAFSNCTSLTSITIPDSVTSIGDGVFFGCANLTSITIPDSVTSIGSYAFYDCSSLTSITIPDSVTSIGDYAFYDCSSLTSITIQNKETAIYDSANTISSTATIRGYDPSTAKTYAEKYDRAFESIVTGVSLNKTSITINKGLTDTLTATVIPSNATNKNVTWKSSNDAIATVDANGNVTAVAKGTATITVTTEDGSFTDTCNVEVKEVYTVTFVDYNNNVLGTDTVNYGGTATAPANPTREGYTFTGWDKDFSSVTEDMTVTAIYSKNEIPNTPPIITLLGDNPTNITVGETFNEPGATAIDLEDGDLTDSIITTGTVDTATVGTYTITYTVTDSGGLTDTKTRTVNVSAVPVLGLNIAPNPITLIIGDTQQVKGILKRTDNSTEDVTNLTNWNINPGDKATISNTGLLQALAAGECTLEAIYNHWNGTEMVAYSDTAQVIITAPTQPVEPVEPESSNPPVQPVEPVEPEPSNPSVQPPSLINPGSSGGYSSSTTKTIEPKEPEKPVINPLELENVFVARLPESTTITDVVAVIELTGESTIPIETPRLKQGQEYRAYYYNADKQKWIALASYANNNKVEFAGDIKEGYVAVFAVDQPIFEDLKPKTDIEVVINRLNGLAITEGYPGNGNIRTFAPERPITGVELATMQARVLGMVQPGQQRLYDILPVYQPVEDVVWYKPYIDSVKPLLPVTEGQTVTATEAVSSIKQLQKIIETKTEDEFKGKLSTPENEVITRADASRLILSLIEGLGW